MTDEGNGGTVVRMADKRVDPEVRRRVYEWVAWFWRRFREEYPGTSQDNFAAVLRISGPGFSLILKHRSAGLDVMMRLHQRLGASLDMMYDYLPPEAVRRKGGSVLSLVDIWPADVGVPKLGRLRERTGVLANPQVAPPRETQAEGRSAQRSPRRPLTSSPLLIVDGPRSFFARGRDVSVSGVGLELPAPVALEAGDEVELRLDVDGLAVHAPGSRVVWVDGGRGGCEFGSLQAADAQALARFVMQA